MGSDDFSIPSVYDLPDDWGPALDQFEALLKAGDSPEIGPCLELVAEEETERLLLELVKTYVSLRQLSGAGLATCVAELVSANPSLSETIRASVFGLTSRAYASPDSLDANNRKPLGAFGPYVLIEEMGRGGFGVVYFACHARDAEFAVLKIARQGPDLAARRAALANEAKVLTRLRSVAGTPKIIEWLDQRYDGCALALEYFPAADLHDEARNRPPSPGEAVAWIVQLCEVLQQTHQRKTFHCDLKPGNVLIRADDSCAELIDFGLSVASSRAGHQPTDPAPRAGTDDYMAPEILAGTQAIPALVDVFGLGALLYFLLTREAPFAEQPTRTARQRVTAYDIDWELLEATAAPEEVKRACRVALARRPTDRFSSPSHLAQALRPHLPSKPERCAEDALTGVPATLPPSVFGRRFHAALIAAAVGVVVLATSLLSPLAPSAASSANRPADGASQIGPFEALPSVDDISYALAEADIDRLAALQPEGSPVERLVKAMNRTPPNSSQPALDAFMARSKSSADAPYWIAGQLRAGLDPNQQFHPGSNPSPQRIKSRLLQSAIEQKNERVAAVLLDKGADIRPVSWWSPDMKDASVFDYLFPSIYVRLLTSFSDRLGQQAAARLVYLHTRDAPIVVHESGHPLHSVMEEAKAMINPAERAHGARVDGATVAATLRAAGWELPNELPKTFVLASDPDRYFPPLEERIMAKLNGRPIETPFDDRSRCYRGLSSWSGDIPIDSIELDRVMYCDTERAVIAVVATYAAAPGDSSRFAHELMLCTIDDSLSRWTLYATRRTPQLSRDNNLVFRKTMFRDGPPDPSLPSDPTSPSVEADVRFLEEFASSKDKRLTLSPFARPLGIGLPPRLEQDVRPLCCPWFGRTSLDDSRAITSATIAAKPAPFNGYVTLEYDRDRQVLGIFNVIYEAADQARR